MGAVHAQLEKGNTKLIEYRMARKDGGLIWVQDRGQLMRREDGREVFYCILLDITETKKAQEDLRLSLERHQIIMDQTNDIIFEWQVKQDTLTSRPTGKRNSAMSRCGKMFMRACWTTRICILMMHHCCGARCRIFWKENLSGGGTSHSEAGRGLFVVPCACDAAERPRG